MNICYKNDMHHRVVEEFRQLCAMDPAGIISIITAVGYFLVKVYKKLRKHGKKDADKTKFLDHKYTECLEQEQSERRISCDSEAILSTHLRRVSVISLEEYEQLDHHLISTQRRMTIT